MAHLLRHESQICFWEAPHLREAGGRRRRQRAGNVDRTGTYADRMNTHPCARFLLLHKIVDEYNSQLAAPLQRGGGPEYEEAPLPPGLREEMLATYALVPDAARNPQIDETQVPLDFCGMLAFFWDINYDGNAKYKIGVEALNEEGQPHA